MVYAIEINPNNFAPAKIATIPSLMKIILPLIMMAVAVFFLIILFQAAFKILTAGENKEAVAKAQKTISFAVLGLILIVSSFLLVRIIGKILGIESILPF